MVALTQVGLVSAKVETTPGVDATPSSTTDYILAINPQYSPTFNVIERNYARPSLSRVPHLMGRQLASLTFSTEIFGTGVAAASTNPTTQNQATPKMADLFLGCGMVGTSVASPAGQTFTPITSSQQTLTIYCYYSGILHKLTGAMGTFKFSAKAGEIATVDWTFTGVFNAPTAVGTPNPSIPSVVPPLVQSCSFVIGGTAATVFLPETIDIDIGNTVTPRSDANSAKGFNSMLITDRNSVVTFNPEAVPEASHPFWTDFAAANVKAITFTVGSTAGNQLQVSIPNFEISDLKYADRNGIRVYDVTGYAVSTAGTGNDEISFKYL